MSGFELTPSSGRGRQIVERYGNGGFTVTGIRYEGSVLIFPGGTMSLDAATAEDLSAAALLEAIAARPTRPRILVVGCGPTSCMPPKRFAQALKPLGTTMEWMTTAAACRTFNILMLEDREVAAALIAI